LKSLTHSHSDDLARNVDNFTVIGASNFCEAVYIKHYRTLTVNKLFTKGVALCRDRRVIATGRWREANWLARKPHPGDTSRNSAISLSTGYQSELLSEPTEHFRPSDRRLGVGRITLRQTVGNHGCRAPSPMADDV
jgi:hypothetical protein